MAYVVFLRGVNVGGHRLLRPAQLARALQHLGCVNIGAAGTFVVRERVPLKELRAALERLVPFETNIAVCHGESIERLLASELGDYRGSRDIVRFVSVLPNKQPRLPSRPIRLPASGRWLVRVLGQQERFVVGEYRRDMKTIGYLGKLDRIIGVPVTTRNWNTVRAIARSLRET